MSDTGMKSGIWLPQAFTIHHQKAVLKHMEEGRWTLSRSEWHWALTGAGQLHKASANTPFGWLRFASIYDKQIEAIFVDRYLDDLLVLNNVEAESTGLWARYARAITAWWYRAGWTQQLGSEGQLLLAYLLFWWRAFATGYAFEVQIFRDLNDSNINFTPHDILSPTGRFSPYDLEVLGLHGDIKTSLYFLRVGRSPGMRHDFYISRFWQQGRLRVMVVLMQPAAFQQINGDAIPTTWAAIKASLPNVAKITEQGSEIMLVPYEEWKARIRYQQQN